MNRQAYNPVQTNMVPRPIKALALIWNIVNSTAYRYSPFFFRGWRRFLLRVFGANIAPSASPSRLAKIDYPWNLTMEAFSSIGPNSWLYGLDRISLGEKCCVGEGVKILTGTHSITDCCFSLRTAPVAVDACAWVATSATLLPGVHIGEGAVVGACAVVTKDVPPWTVVAGNPAKEVKKRVIRDAGAGGTP